MKHGNNCLFFLFYKPILSGDFTLIRLLLPNKAYGICANMAKNASFCILNIFNGRVEEFLGDAECTALGTFPLDSDCDPVSRWWTSRAPMETYTAAAQPLLSICIYNPPPPAFIKVSISQFPWCFIQLGFSNNLQTQSQKQRNLCLLKCFSFGLVESKHTLLWKRKGNHIHAPPRMCARAACLAGGWPKFLLLSIQHGLVCRIRTSLQGH